MHIEKIYDKLSHKLRKLDPIFTSWGLFKYTNNLVIGNIDLKLRKDQVNLSKVYMNKLTQILLNDLRRILKNKIMI